jgi:hypothetical protein
MNLPKYQIGDIVFIIYDVDFDGMLIGQIENIYQSFNNEWVYQIKGGEECKEHEIFTKKPVDDNFSAREIEREIVRRKHLIER